MDEKILIDIVTQKMPYGKYKNRFIYQLPEPYLVVVSQQRISARQIRNVT